jgi:hypothetical protein
MKILIYIGILFMSTKLIAQKIYEDVKIKRFKSELLIERNGNIEVSEKITCVFKKSNDNPLFIRKFSRRYKNLNLKKEYNSSFQIKSLKIDQQPMVYESVIRGDSVFVYFGKGSEMILPGNYEFEFKYIIENQLSCSENQDYCELTWDVNEFNSGYAIDQLICIVSAEEKNILSYPRSNGGSMVPTSLGHRIEGGKYCSIQSDTENVVFKSIKKYKPDEGERIVVYLPKDYFFPAVVNFAIERDKLKYQKILDRAHKQSIRDNNDLAKAKASKIQASPNKGKKASERDVEKSNADGGLYEQELKLEERSREDENTINQDETIGLYERDSFYTMCFTVIGILLIGSFYFVVWRRYGKDPPEDTVYPVYYPPYNLQPSAMGYILDYFDMTTGRYFTGEILNLVSKNAMRIEKRKNHRESIVFVKNEFTELTPSDYELNSSEEELLSALFPTGNELVISPENRFIILEAKLNVLRHSGSQNENNRLFDTNDKWVIFGWLISAIYFMLGWWVCFQNIEFYVPLVLVVIAVIMRFIVPSFSRYKIIRGLLYGFIFLFLTLFCLYFFATFASGLYFLFWLFLLGINYRFIDLLKAPTALGQIYMADIKGFKMYLSKVGNFKNSTFNSFQLGQNELDRYLPYAHALGVQINWVEEFEDQFENELHPKN